MKRQLLATIFGLLVPALTALAAERVIATLNDPSGDDVGDGSLVYPQRSEFQRGDLDLVQLRLVREDRDYRIEATFRNPIRHPSTIASDAGSETLSTFARRGFYGFNLDLYFDQDRVRGSGNVYTLPGRRAGIDESHAWEKAIVLTPRPELMRQQLIDTVIDTEKARDRDAVAARIDRSIHFATQVRVRGRMVSFVVPASFLTAPRAEDGWSVVALVTGAKTSIEADLGFFDQSRTPLERLVLGAMQPASGRPHDSFGYSTPTAPSPIVDLLAESAEAQRRALQSADALAGTPLGAAGAALAPGSARPVTSLLAQPALPPVQPKPAASQALSPSSALPSAAELVPAMPAPPAVAPAVPAGSQPRPAPQPEARAPSRAIAERLHQLQQLFEQKIISEAEYKQQRQRILNEL